MSNDLTVQCGLIYFNFKPTATHLGIPQLRIPVNSGGNQSAHVSVDNAFLDTLERITRDIIQRIRSNGSFNRVNIAISFCFFEKLRVSGRISMCILYIYLTSRRLEITERDFMFAIRYDHDVKRQGAQTYVLKRMRTIPAYGIM